MNPTSPLSGLKIMVIDDSSTIRRSAEIFLVQAGCQVILAEELSPATCRFIDLADAKNPERFSASHDGFDAGSLAELRDRLRLRV